MTDGPRRVVVCVVDVPVDTENGLVGHRRVRHGSSTRPFSRGNNMCTRVPTKRVFVRRAITWAHSWTACGRLPMWRKVSWTRAECRRTVSWRISRPWSPAIVRRSAARRGGSGLPTSRRPSSTRVTGELRLLVADDVPAHSTCGRDYYYERCETDSRTAGRNGRSVRATVTRNRGKRIGTIIGKRRTVWKRPDVSLSRFNCNILSTRRKRLDIKHSGQPDGNSSGSGRGLLRLITLHTLHYKHGPH